MSQPLQYEPYKNIDISCKDTFGIKNMWPSKVEYISGSEYMSRLTTTRSDIRMRPRLSILNANATWTYYS